MNNTFNVEPIMDRQFLAQRVDAALQKLATGEDKSILNFWGCPGGGRTTLLEEFKARLMSKENLSVLGIWDVNPGSASMESIIADIQNSLDNTSLDKIKVILIDNLRALEANGSDDPIFLQFEHDLMATLVHRKDVLTLIISQHEIRQWHELVVRMRQASYLIPPLSRQEFESKAREMGLIPDEAYARTLGHPLPLEWIKENPEISISEIDARAAEYFLKDLKKDVQEETKVLSLLIQFDEALMEKVLKGAGLARRKNYFALLESIRHMGFAGLIVHNSRTGTYHFTDPSVRQLLARGYRSENPEYHKRVQSILLGYYMQAAKRPSTLHHFFVNLVYHMAWEATLTNSDASKQCKEWLTKMLPAWRDADWKAVQDAWVSREADPFVSAELDAMLGKDMCGDISQFVHTQVEKQNGTAND